MGVRAARGAAKGAQALRLTHKRRSCSFASVAFAARLPGCPPGARLAAALLDSALVSEDELAVALSSRESGYAARMARDLAAGAGMAGADANARAGARVVAALLAIGLTR